MSDLTELPDGTIDLDEYRRQRVEEGTWPPNDLTVQEYWRRRRRRGEPPRLPEGGGQAARVLDFAQGFYLEGARQVLDLVERILPNEPPTP